MPQGTTATVRYAGLPASGSATGFPTEPDSTVKIRWVDDLLTNMSERSTDFLKYIGGFSQFSFNNSKVEWVEDDVWNRRPGIVSLAQSATALTITTTTAHRYPIGTVLYNITKDEYVRVTATASASGLTVVRDIIEAQVTQPAWATTDEVIVAGTSMSEETTWTNRPTPTMALPYNFAQVSAVSVEVTYRRMETALYGLRGSDLDKITADTVAEQFVSIEQASVFGARWSGEDATKPSMFGGLQQYINSTDATITDLNGAVLTRKDIDDLFQTLFYLVGPEKMAKTIVTSAWGKRKISSFFSAGERLGPMANQAGVAIDRFNTDFGPVDVLLHTSLAKDQMYFINSDNHRIGHHGQRGRPHLEEAPSATAGPFMRRAFYGDLSMINSGPQGEGRIQEFSTSA